MYASRQCLAAVLTLLTPMLLVAIFGQYKTMQKTSKITETTAYGYSSESIQPFLASAILCFDRRMIAANY